MAVPVGHLFSAFWLGHTEPLQEIDGYSQIHERLIYLWVGIVSQPPLGRGNGVFVQSQNLPWVWADEKLGHCTWLGKSPMVAL